MNRRRFLSFLGLGAVAGPAAVSAAPTFIEAQPPSAINDAARAAMAGMAEFRDHLIQSRSIELPIFTSAPDWWTEEELAVLRARFPDFHIIARVNDDDYRNPIGDGAPYKLRL